MRITLALTILAAMVTAGATWSPVLSAPVFALQDAGAVTNQGGPMGPTEIDLVKWGFTQGGLTLVLIVVLFSYRRDFFRKHEAKQAETDAKQAEIDALRADKRELVAVLDKNANAMIHQAVAVNANTEATKLLAQNVNNLAERRNRG